MKTLKLYLPEIYFIIAVVYYWSLTALLINWVAIVLLITLGVLILSKQRPLGVLLSCVFGIINLYLVLALFSELSEFTSFNFEAKKLLFVGLLFLGSNIFFSLFMLKKYLTINQKKVLIDA